MTDLFFNPLQEGFADDPWPHLAEMRAAEPVHPLAIGGFLRRFPNARVVGDPVWNGRTNLRGLDELVVDVS